MSNIILQGIFTFVQAGLLALAVNVGTPWVIALMSCMFLICLVNYHAAISK